MITFNYVAHAKVQMNLGNYPQQLRDRERDPQNLKTL